MAHAGYEMPDLDKQAEYYTDILVFVLFVVKARRLRCSSPRVPTAIPTRRSFARAKNPQCTRVGFHNRGPYYLTSNEFEKQTQAQARGTARKKDPEPSISDMLVFEDPRGTTIEVFKCDDFSHDKFDKTGHRAAQAWPRRLPLLKM